jgi:hypothetical protein
MITYVHKTSRYGSAVAWIGPFHLRVYYTKGGKMHVHAEFKVWVNFRRTLHVEMVPGKITARFWKNLLPKEW